MMMRNIAVSLLCAAALAACDQPTPEAEAPPAQTGQGTLISTMPRTLSADEAANFQVALTLLPEGATLSHAVAEGPSVALHYTATGANGSTAGVQYLIFDANHAITDTFRVDVPANPQPHLAGATPEAPETTNSQTEATNKRVVLAFFQALTSGQVDGAANNVAEDMVEHTGAGAQGKAAWVSAIRGEPARQYGLQHIAAWNDIVIAYNSVGTATSSGTRWVPGYDIFRVRDGKIVERWRLNY